MGRSRGGLTSKIHALVDSSGLPVRLALSAGEAHDNRLAGKLRSRLKSGSMLLADRGYDADWIRELAMKKGARANNPPKNNRNDPICFSRYLHRARNQVGRFFNRIKQCGRVATLYDRLAANHLAFVSLHLFGYGWLRVMSRAPSAEEMGRNPGCWIYFGIGSVCGNHLSVRISGAGTPHECQNLRIGGHERELIVEGTKD
jgi:transposase